MVWLTFRSAAQAALWCLTALASADMPLFTDVDKFNAFAASLNGTPRQTFRSSNIVAPVFSANLWEKELVDNESHIFLGVSFGDGLAGPMIFDAQDLSLVYADQQYLNVLHSDMQEINGTGFLTFWAQAPNMPLNNGYCLVFDNEYNLKYNVTAQGLGQALADRHELNITPEGTIVFTTTFIRPADCSLVGGPRDCDVLDGGFQEVDAATNQVLFNWTALEHFSLRDTNVKYSENNKSPFDYFHINSVEKTTDGHYLISSRAYSTVSLINGTDGKPIWFLGGPMNQFKDLSNGKATNFNRQHHPRFHLNQSQITIFDDHGDDTAFCQGVCHTRGLNLEIDTDKMEIRLLQEYFHPQRVNSGLMGSVQILDNENVIIGFGSNPSFVEFNKNGTPVLNVQRGLLGTDMDLRMKVYRVSKHNWTGNPTWPPSIAVDAPSGTTDNATVYLSWNGATEVASWAVFAADSISALDSWENKIEKCERSGFETTISLLGSHRRRYLRALALSASGRSLGHTAIIDMRTAQAVPVYSSHHNY